MNNKKRCCRTCKYLLRQNDEHVCYEGGFSEIGDIDKKLSMQDCNAWQEKSFSFWLYEYACDTCHSVWYMQEKINSPLDIDFGCPHGCDDAGRYVGKMLITEYKYKIKTMSKNKKLAVI